MSKKKHRYVVLSICCIQMTLTLMQDSESNDDFDSREDNVSDACSSSDPCSDKCNDDCALSNGGDDCALSSNGGGDCDVNDEDVADVPGTENPEGGVFSPLGVRLSDLSVYCKTFVLYKAYDLISDGEYRKLIVRCKDNGDLWAEKVYLHVQCMSQLLRRIVSEVNTLEDYGKMRLKRVCSEVISSVVPPIRRRPGWSFCCITGARSDDCIDLTRFGKSSSVVTVHKRFSHFLVMLWLIVKFEHVCKVLARHWLVANPSGGVNSRSNGRGRQSRVQSVPQPGVDVVNLTVNELCQAFEKENQENVTALCNAFVHGFSHVMCSLQRHKSMPDVEVCNNALHVT